MRDTELYKHLLGVERPDEERVPSACYDFKTRRAWKQLNGCLAGIGAHYGPGHPWALDATVLRYIASTS